MNGPSQQPISPRWPNARSAAPEEMPAFRPAAGPLDLADVVVTTDALQTHPEAAEFLVTANGRTTWWARPV